VKAGLADGERLCIDGGSAGGYTTLGALAFRDVFKAGTSLYGIGDLTALAGDTHKFESRYLDGLIGAFPQEMQLYKERSPIESVDTLVSSERNEKLITINTLSLTYIVSVVSNSSLTRCRGQGCPTQPGSNDV
jgi:hypothetical protein